MQALTQPVHREEQDRPAKHLEVHPQLQAYSGRCMRLSPVAISYVVPPALALHRHSSRASALLLEYPHETVSGQLQEHSRSCDT